MVYSKQKQPSVCLPNKMPSVYGMQYIIKCAPTGFKHHSFVFPATHFQAKCEHSEAYIKLVTNDDTSITPDFDDGRCQIKAVWLNRATACMTFSMIFRKITGSTLQCFRKIRKFHDFSMSLYFPGFPETMETLL